jgi:cytochrome c oxidase cbb3-type subunit 3
MWLKNGRLATAVLGLTISAAAQAPPAAAPRRVGGFVPGLQRPAEDPVQVTRGKTLYEVSCRGCHGADLRGGDMGGPNLLRSQLALSDREGELIVPIIQGSRQEQGMPAIPMSPQDGKAVSAYVRTVLATIGRQGMPPEVGLPPPSILVGDGKAGQKYFAAKCASCHSVTGDLRGIATKLSDDRTLQNTWVGGGGRGRGPGAPGAPSARTPTVIVTLPSGEKVEGRLIRIDDFIVSLSLADGGVRTFRRNGEDPKVEVRDPMKGHRDLLAIYTDRDIHDVTAYLVTLK